MTDALWYFARGSGVVSLVLLSVVVALGIGARSGRTAFGLPAFVVSLLHRNAALLAVVFLAGHVVSLLFDPYAQLRVFDIVLPFAGNYRPVWQGLGTLAFDLVLAVVVTSLLRHRLGARAWRLVHWLAYVCWPIALLHGLGTGSDNGTVWLWSITAVCAAAVLAAAFWRVSPTLTRFPQRARRRIHPRLQPLPSSPAGPAASPPARPGPSSSAQPARPSSPAGPGTPSFAQPARSSSPAGPATSSFAQPSRPSSPTNPDPSSFAQPGRSSSPAGPGTSSFGQPGRSSSPAGPGTSSFGQPGRSSSPAGPGTSSFGQPGRSSSPAGPGTSSFAQPGRSSLPAGSGTLEDMR
ncbi:ferric reductase-like transmembrane domain-containing protein [Actinoplanes sp. URMC 104]|uniref:ferric reductase-like transmembrane domain-containing protein n=1 Tax=Actinoplanes sp. URMC 104 TaxID=3423409 RepID=UPI003F1BA81B